MEIIPVIDLMQGQVVHARRGDRANYRPIASNLCSSSSAEAVVQGLLELYPFTKLYIADLDAILGQGDHRQDLENLRRIYPGLEIWLDAGVDSPDALQRWQGLGLQPVIGSESISNLDYFLALRDACGPDGFILSLDHYEGKPRGIPELLEYPESWPSRMICMTLDRVGSDRGPHWELLQQLHRQAPRCRWHAAGGVRTTEDLDQLAGQGVAGILVASALHDGRLGAEQIRRFKA